MRFLRFFTRPSAFVRVAATAIATSWLGCASESTSAFSVVDEEDAGQVLQDGGIVIPDPQDGAAVDARPPSPTCSAYCASVESACVGENAAYSNTSECLALCDAMPLGAVGDRSGDSIACRSYHAGTVPPRCAAAGPWGGETCGSRCESFCRTAEALCPDAYETVASCIKVCAATPGIRWDAGAVDGVGGPSSGNTLNCRAHYLRRAVSDPSACANVALVAPACE